MQTALSGGIAADGSPAESAQPAEGPDAAGGEHAQHTAAGEHDHGDADVAASSTGLSYDRVLDAARSADLEAQKIELVPGQGPGTAWTVSVIDRSWPTQVDVAAVDPAAAEVVGGVGRVPARGTLRRVPPAGALVLGAVVVGVALFLPVLGVSLLAFLALDVLLGLRGRGTRSAHRADAPPSPGP